MSTSKQAPIRKTLPTVAPVSTATASMDDKKLRWDLVQPAALREYVAVLTYGATKHAVDGWRSDGDGHGKFFSKAMSHLWAWWMGEKRDPVSGLHHLGHAICYLAFLLETEKEAELGFGGGPITFGKGHGQ